METPISSSRRVTRSQTMAARNSNKNSVQKQDQSARSALIDITNDSPIVGLAKGVFDTPSSTMSKKRFNGGFTPGSGSGEALLRGQVKTLLQKVEEEAEFSKTEKGPLFNLKCAFNSPMNLLAPTPANTPQILNPVEDDLVISQKKEEGTESENGDLIMKALDFSGVKKKLGVDDDDDDENDDASSVWSTQVNASSTKDEEEEYDDEDEKYACKGGAEEEEEEEEDDEEGEVVDELCKGISGMNVNGGKVTAKFSGKHTRFVYNSDSELQGEEEVCEN